MDRILVGDDECSYLDVCNHIKDSGFAMQLYSDMGIFARQLGSSPESCLQTDQQLILGIRSHFLILYDLLASWRGAMANRATLENLVIALENIGLAQLGGLFYAKFQPVAKRQRRCKYSTAPVDLGWFMSTIGNILILCSPDPAVAYERISENSSVRITDLKNDQDLLMFNGQSSQSQIIAVQTNNVVQMLQHSYQIAGKILLITTENCQVLLQQYSDFLDLFGAIIIKETFSWSDLTDEYKTELLHNCKYLQNIDATLIENTLVGEYLCELLKSPPLSLEGSTIPEPITYYIPRRILSRNIISSDIFKIKSDSIFLFSGIKRHELSVLADGKATDTSSSQKSQPNLTVNYIFLETKLDFEAIASKTTRAVHWFHKDNDELTWVLSTGALYEIQRFVEDKSQKRFFDTEFLQKLEESKLTDKSKFPVCISDTPGMGKTILLGQLARQLVSQEKIVIFIVTSEFLDTLKKKFGKKVPFKKTDSVIEVICSVFTKDLERKLVEMNLKCNEAKVELLFDGLDEARSEDLLLIYDCFREISSRKSTRMWVTTRPHLLHALENELNVFGYNIAAFNTEDQHHFLERYWYHKNPQLEQGKLQRFAEECLHILKKNMTSKEQDIAGVPLQCLLIGEVFQQEAINYSTPDNSLQAESYIPSIQIKSISDLYKRLVKLKFQKYFDRYSIHESQVQESDLENMHIHLSLLLLFPNRVKTFNAFLKNNSNLTVEDVFKVGILESATVIPIPRFIHRTFAEYFIAVLVINVLMKGGVKPMPKFFLEEVLKNNSIKFEINPLTKWKVEVRSIKHKVISYFIDNMLEDIKPNDMLISLLQQSPKQSHLSNLVVALVYENHLNIFNFFRTVYNTVLEKSEFFKEVVVYVAILRCSLPFLKIVCNYFNCIQKGELYTLLHNAAFPCSVLDIAASRGSFEVVEYLVTIHNFKVAIDQGKAECLLHHILHQSKFDDESTVIGKINITNYLKTLNFPHFEKKFEGNTPILSKNVHLKLLFEMIILNVNFLATDQKGNTILHLAVDYLSSSEYCQLIDKIPNATIRKLIPIRTKSGLTPMHMVAKKRDFKETILQSFLNCNVDIRQNKRLVNSLFLAAVKSNRNLSFLKTLISMGAETSSSSLFYVAIKYGAIDAIHCLLSEKNLKSTDSDGNTPLHSLLCHCYNIPEVNKTLSTFIENKLDVNIPNTQGSSPLVYALESGMKLKLTTLELLEKYGVRVETYDFKNGKPFLNTAIENEATDVIDWLISKQADVNASDSHGNTPLHKLLYYCYKFKDLTVKITQNLIEHQANVNIKNNDGKSPLLYVLDIWFQRLDLNTIELLERHGAVEGSETATKLLLYLLNCEETFHNDTYLRIFSTCVKNGADITIEEKCFLLYKLVREKCILGVKFLLLQGWDTNEKLLHTRSFSADSLSVNGKNELQIDFSVLNHGIYENSEHVNERVLLQATMIRGTIEAVKSLYELDPFKEAFKNGDLLFIAVKNLPIELVKFMCECYIREKGESIISLVGNGDEKSLLHAACKDKARHEVSKYFLESHVLDIHLKESRMRDLIHVCVFGTYEKNSSLVKETIGILEMLIKRDPSLLHETDEEGRTPLLRKDIHIDVLESLINGGANKYAVDKEGNSVLQVALASWCGNKDKLTKLLK